MLDKKPAYPGLFFNFFVQIPIIVMSTYQTRLTYMLLPYSQNQKLRFILFFLPIKTSK